MTEPEKSDRDEALRRRRLDAIFGDVLPDPTRDERVLGGDIGSAEEDSAGERERDLLSDVPPHHG
ncbi:MAG: hypothetical protein H0T14_04055 [Nocardioidaceae bacterium]|nr:hypothetical protein [Nocardioidaceae bacterium]